ncbi:hypothetical protein SAMN04487995_3864 [Dyadobacter koreensis]|uniref:Uncharacterized protein n=1 Tax=Dyadobacter koreensis TaxID=408657 RepID=A0A1H6XCD2_9BACT|nr:hypothetical protein [Dyadobacter koreensis]SEJ26841.1 hypothetical protein SAMN04487995_3864 [Dyadobacter koreensis]
MTIPKTFFAILLSCILIWGCQNEQKEQQLAQREQAVSKKEQEFALKEADYISLLKMRDSLLTKKDTLIIQHWPENIAGLWSGRSVCRESNCSEYVIGDQRANQWEFISDSTGLYTRVIDKNNKTVRVYNARFDSTGINLQFSSDTSATKMATLTVDLNPLTNEVLKGIQTININQSCTAKFYVELTRSTQR